MGHGTSTAKEEDEFNPLFCNKESLDGNKAMADDDVARAFIYFIKSGQWKDNFGNYFHAEEYVTISLDQLARGKTCVFHNYLLPTSRIEECIFAPLSPVSHDCESLFDVRSVACTTLEENFGTLFDESKPIATAEKRQRNAELLNEIASEFPEAHLVREAQTTNWAIDSWRGFNHSKICIAIVDTLAPKYPFVYANRPFRHVTGHRSKHLLGAPFSILFGINTETMLSDILIEAISQGKSARVGLLLYTEQRYEMVCMVSVKAAGRYCAINIINTETLLHEKELKITDDVLCLLTCVIKNPPSMTSPGKSTTRKRSSIRRSALGPALAALVPPSVAEGSEIEDS